MLRRASLALRMRHPCGMSLPFAPYEKSINSGNFFEKNFCFIRQNLHTESMQEVCDLCLTQTDFVCGKRLGTFREKSTDNVPNSGRHYIFPTLNCLSWSHLMHFRVSVALVQLLPLDVYILMQEVSVLVIYAWFTFLSRSEEIWGQSIE